MRRRIVAITVIIAASLIGAYYYFAGKEYVFQLSETQLQQKLSERLPIQKKYLFIVEVILDNPRMMLVNGSNRVNAGLDVTLNIYIDNDPLPLGGSIDMSGGIRYDAEAGSFYLTDPIVENLKIQGIPNKYAEHINKALTKALAEYYSERPIYTLSSLDIRQATTKIILKDVRVKNKELIMTLGI